MEVLTQPPSVLLYKVLTPVPEMVASLISHTLQKTLYCADFILIV